MLRRLGLKTEPGLPDFARALRSDDRRAGGHRHEDPCLPESDQLPECPAVFNARFSRCHGLLSMTARRVLGGGERMEEAVQNCWPVASRNPPSFESEAAFRSWLFRLLIDEAWAVLNQNQSKQEFA
jgi:hypothetical protein